MARVLRAFAFVIPFVACGQGTYSVNHTCPKLPAATGGDPYGGALYVGVHRLLDKGYLTAHWQAPVARRMSTVNTEIVRRVMAAPLRKRSAARRFAFFVGMRRNLEAGLLRP